MTAKNSNATRVSQKQCFTCKEWKVLETEFHHKSSSADGRSPNCIICVKRYLKARREEEAKKIAPHLSDDQRTMLVAGLTVELSRVPGSDFDQAVALAKRLTDRVIVPIVFGK